MRRVGIDVSRAVSGREMTRSCQDHRRDRIAQHDRPADLAELSSGEVGAARLVVVGRRVVDRVVVQGRRQHLG